MAYKLGADGTWTHIPEASGGGGGGDYSGGGGGSEYGGGGSGGNGGQYVEKGNVHTDDNAVNEITENKKEKLKFVETGNAKIIGATNARKSNWLNILNGTADRWLGRWLILGCTHTIDAKGYTVDLEVGRKPVKVENISKAKSKKSGSDYGSDGSQYYSGYDGDTTSPSTPNSSKNAEYNSAPSTSNSDRVWKLGADGTWTSSER